MGLYHRQLEKRAEARMHGRRYPASSSGTVLNYKTALKGKTATYSKALQHSLTNTPSSHCAHNLVLQVKSAASCRRHSVFES